MMKFSNIKNMINISQLKNIYVNCFLIIGAIFSLWLVWYFTADLGNEGSSLHYVPDEFVRNINVIGMNNDGHWYYQFSSPFVLHYSQKNRTTFTLPYLEVYQNNAPMWQLTALKGEALFGNKEIHLLEQVKLSQAKGKYNTPTDIYTDALTMYPAAKIVETSDHILAIKPHAKVESIGMHLDLITKTLKLLSHVKGKFIPPSNKEINIISDQAILIKGIQNTKEVHTLSSIKKNVDYKESTTSVFQGHVQLTQDSSIVVTPQLTIYTDQHDELIKAVAQGSGTTYRNNSSSGKPPFVANALKIEYFPLQQLIHLIGNAKATQGKNSYAAPEIYYHTDSDRVSSYEGRMTLVIVPKTFKKAAS